MRRVSKRAIGTVSLGGVVVVIVILAIALGYYLVTSSFARGPSDSTSQSAVAAGSSSNPTSTNSCPSCYNVTAASNASSVRESTGLSSLSIESLSTLSSISYSTCTTYTVSSIPNGTQPDYAPLFAGFKEMSVNYAGESGASAFNMTASFTVLKVNGSAAATTYEINATNINDNSKVQAGSFVLAWVMANGTAKQVEIGKTNMTGPTAQAYFLEFFSPFQSELPQFNSLNVFTNSSSFQTGNQTSTTIGKSDVRVTDYAAKTLPLNVAACTGTITLNRFSLQTGDVAGLGFPLVTFEQLQGSYTTSTITEALNVFVKLVYLAPAS